MLAIGGVLLVSLNFIDYNSRDGKVNAATWFIWVLGDAFEAGTFFVATGEDLVKNAVPIAFAIGTTITFGISLWRKRFGWPDVFDRFVVLVDVLIMVGWILGLYNAITATILLVASEGISFIPLNRGVLNGNEQEYIMPWVWCAGADVLFIMVLTRLPGAEIEMTFPVVQLLAHLSIIVCIVIRMQIERRVPA